jgi:hypothetical protein
MPCPAAPPCRFFIGFSRSCPADGVSDILIAFTVSLSRFYLDLFLKFIKLFSTAQIDCAGGGLFCGVKFTKRLTKRVCWMLRLNELIEWKN